MPVGGAGGGANTGGGASTGGIANTGGASASAGITSACTTPGFSAIAVSAGSDYTCILTKAGGVRCWGHNERGVLGDGTTTDRVVPPDTDVLTGVTQIATGFDTTCALMISGGLRCWGAPFGLTPGVACWLVLVNVLGSCQ